MNTTFTLESNSSTEFTISKENIVIYVMSGACIIETIYKDMLFSVEKTVNQSYHISIDVQYRLINSCNVPCQLSIIDQN